MTARIRTLDRKVVDVIAAGEVVERPASVVKELVENALDAGATRVAVFLEDGGRRSIRVEDDGGGMEAGDLALAFAPHATSKISSVGDLATVATYGFRGEALASIGAVSEAAVTSRLRGESAGNRVENRRGDLGPVGPAAHPEGTTVEVRALFSGIPARRKFLRTAGTETARVTEVLARFALARPDAGFTLTADGRDLFKAPAGEAAEDRAARVLGRDGARALLRVDAASGPVRVEGFLAPPDAASAGRAPQYLAVNGRAVSDRTVSHAVRAGLEGLVTVHRQPAWYLSVTLPPESVDVNVHPAKSEVRFRRPSEVHGAVRAAVREAVLAGERAPEVDLEERRGRDGIREALDAYLGGIGRPERQNSFFFPAAGEEVPEDPGAGADEAWDSLEVEGGPPPGVLQVRRSFLVFETPDGIAVVDQHALHERLLLERLRSRTRSGAVEVQRLLVPEVLETGPADAARAAEAAPMLRKAGLLLEPFGEAAVAVHGVPRLLAGRPVRPLAEAALRRLAEEKDPGDGEALLHGILESMACHAAVRAGDPLEPAMMQALLEEGRALDSGGHCAHGRPTELRIPFTELEKRFRRT